MSCEKSFVRNIICEKSKVCKTFYEKSKVCKVKIEYNYCVNYHNCEKLCKIPRLKKYKYRGDISYHILSTICKMTYLKLRFLKIKNHNYFLSLILIYILNKNSKVYYTIIFLNF